MPRLPRDRKSSRRAELLTLAQAADRLPHRPNACTVWRWCRKGYAGVRLEYLRMGRRMYVTRGALKRFGEAVARAESPEK